MVDLRADGASLARRRPAVNGRRPCTGPSRSAILSGPMPLPGEDWVACPRCRTALVRIVRGGIPRPSCPRCGFVFFANPGVGAACVIRDAAGRVLLVRRAPGQFGAGASCFPCGFVEWGEEAGGVMVAAAGDDPGAASGVLAPRLVRLARHHYPDGLLAGARAPRARRQLDVACIACANHAYSEKAARAACGRRLRWSRRRSRSPAPPPTRSRMRSASP